MEAYVKQLGQIHKMYIIGIFILIEMGYLTNSAHAIPGADPSRGGGGGGAHPARAPSKIGNNMICWRKIVIFHTKYPKNFRASLRSAQFF